MKTQTLGYTYKGNFYCESHAKDGIGEEYPTSGFTTAKDSEGNECRMISKDYIEEGRPAEGYSCKICGKKCAKVKSNVKRTQS